MALKKTTQQKRAIKNAKRRNAAAPVSKKAPKPEFNDDRNNTLEGYDEDEYDQKDRDDARRRRGKG